MYLSISKAQHRRAPALHRPTLLLCFLLYLSSSRTLLPSLLLLFVFRGFRGTHTHSSTTVSILIHIGSEDTLFRTLLELSVFRSTSQLTSYFFLLLRYMTSSVFEGADFLGVLKPKVKKKCDDDATVSCASCHYG